MLLNLYFLFRDDTIVIITNPDLRIESKQSEVLCRCTSLELKYINSQRYESFCKSCAD